jgi:hypothetical protein
VPYTCIKGYKHFSLENGAADFMVRAQTTHNVIPKHGVGENCFVISVSLPIVSYKIITRVHRLVGRLFSDSQCQYCEIRQ